MAKTYTVQSGDTLSHIAAQECNNAITWQQIAADNHITNPNLIQVGQTIILNCPDDPAPSPAPLPPAPTTSTVPTAATVPSTTPNYIAGVDASYAQPSVDWASLRSQGVRFGIVKATDGTQTLDTQFASNWSGMHANGIVRGAYHYFRVLQDAQAQVDHYLSTVNLDATDLPPFVDAESAGNNGGSNSQWASGLTLWLQQVEKRTGRTPIIYTSVGFWNGLGMADLTHYPLWVANWRSPTSQPVLPNHWKNWTFWQYSSPSDTSTPHSGLNASFDLNFFNGTLDQLQSFIQSGPPH